MKKREAFDAARKDWEKEEEIFRQTGKYKFETETNKWLANLSEARTLARNLNSELKRIKEGIDLDEKALEHHAYKNDWTCNRFGMRTIDVENAARLVRILSTALKELNAFREDASRD